MKKVTYKQTGNFDINESYEGQPLEFELRRITQEKSPIQSISPEIFTERKDGARPEFDIRTDKCRAHQYLTAQEQEAQARANPVTSMKET